MFCCFFLVWYLICACGFIPSCFARKALPIPWATVLSWETQTEHASPRFISAVHCCQPMLFLCSISGASLPRSTISLLLSFTLNQASAKTSHPIVPSRENGKFTCLGFVGGFWAWLYWSGSCSWVYDSWNGLSSSHIQKWSHHYHLFLGKCIIGCLLIILMYETYLPLSSTPLWVFQSSDPDYHVQETPYQNEAFHDWISLWQKVSSISLKYPPFFSFFEKDDSSDIWEVASCLSALLDDGIIPCTLCTLSLKLHILTVGRGWQWCIKVFFISISSHSIRDWPVTFSHHLADLTRWTRHIFLGHLRD